MIECMIAAPQSGGGKTVMTCALLAALKHQGHRVCAFKCGPDYIDPMFHRAVLGVDSHNLDLFLSEEATVRSLYARYTQGHDVAVCEGVMGFYDGVGGTTTRASAWHLAEVLDLPVLLVLRPKGASLTLAAIIQGLKHFRPNSHLAGILLNDCKPMLYQTLAPMLERETGLPVLGYLPPMEEACLESRHLGLYTAGEVRNLAARIRALSEQAEKTVDLSRIQALCMRPERRAKGNRASVTEVPLAVARDEAFCFCYAETLDALRAAGAEPVFFSPLRDKKLPAGCAGLYLPGGYPELHAEELSRNEAMRRAVKEALEQGIPTVAECGGFLYLGRTLEDDQGTAWPMAGSLPGQGYRTGRLVRFGYAELTAKTDSMLLRAGETVPIHEFHYWDSTQNGTDCVVQKTMGRRQWECGFVSQNLFASFAHLYMAGAPQLAERFVAAARRYERKRGTCPKQSN
ncbi:cobyrinate a,c-diamide synthase [Subdoligranulum variabile]|uniref:Cobyrinate a,c-diamide synthase n=1 Tax=Subdoligranulum variabile DSM 15176 TaxID=411471 RepID=D1PMC4_9FIRM|nr:cobyrinate a,c-diamide synthase [Subdoligranulum variabile]EFB75709.1 cobyrinic acid a,c-diamide synthase [Subdoligranulum variabile DSM 15176]UWP68410.1 cobyrinate a,c-diamide synthase [Subdoligranulum variabile]